MVQFGWLRSVTHPISLALLAVTAALLVAMGLQPSVRAEPPPAVVVLGPSSAPLSGRPVDLPSRVVGHASLVEPRLGGALRDATVLAVSSDGAYVAIAGGGPSGPLTVAGADGRQVDISLPGARGASIHPSGSWLAAVDGLGVLWRIEASDGAAQQLASGPFAAAVTVLPNERILAIRVSSLDAPIWADAVTLDPSSGQATLVDPGTPPETALVYGAQPLGDGSFAIARHRVGGGVALLRIAPDGTTTTIAELDDATRVTSSPDGSALAWLSAGRVGMADADQGTQAVDLGAGESARFSPDGSLVLVFAGGGSWVADRSGAWVTDTVATACWLGVGGGCRP